MRVRRWGARRHGQAGAWVGGLAGAGAWRCGASSVRFVPFADLAAELSACAAGLRAVLWGVRTGEQSGHA